MLSTFNLLKNVRFKTIVHNVVMRSMSSMPSHNVGECPLVEASGWPEREEPELRASVLAGLELRLDLVSPAEEEALLDELRPYLDKMRYEFDHWDNAIQGYRETERAEWRRDNLPALDRVRAAAAARSRSALLPHVHVLDLHARGHIRAHVDSERFCGDAIAGLSLLSDAVMVLVPERAPRLELRLPLPRRSLYVLSGAARYLCSHAVPAGGAGAAGGAGPAGGAAPRGRRVSLICRSQPNTK